MQTKEQVSKASTREIDKAHENSVPQSSCGFPIAIWKRIFIEEKDFVFWSGGYKYIKRVQFNHISSWLIDEKPSALWTVF
jgi:hypothetical protein